MFRLCLVERFLKGRFQFRMLTAQIARKRQSEIPNEEDAEFRCAAAVGMQCASGARALCDTADTLESIRLVFTRL